MCYVTLIEKTGLSSKGKSIKHSRGRSIQFIVIKLAIQVGLIKVQILCGNPRKKNLTGSLEVVILIRLSSKLVYI